MTWSPLHRLTMSKPVGQKIYPNKGRQGNIKQNTTNQGYQQDR
jgi:hypothetical protein